MGSPWVYASGMRKILLLLAASALTLGALINVVPAGAQSSPYDTPLPAYDVCGINMPHPGSDWLDEYYKSTTGDPHYSCIAKHPGATHYYIVCHDRFSNAWWWRPGVQYWLSGQCD